MNYTYLDYFNYYMKEYVNNLINTFPETRDQLLLNYRPLLENRDDKNDFYAKCFFTKINNFLPQIAKRDVTLFETPSKIFIEGVDLYNIWHNQHATEETHTANWKYLQILMILGRKIIPNHKEIIDLLHKVSQGEINIPAKVEHTLSSNEKDNIDEDDTPSVFGLGDIASSISGLGKIANSLGLGNLATGDDSGNGIGNLIKGFGEMFSNTDFVGAMSQLAQNMTTTTPSTTDAQPAEEQNQEGSNCPPASNTEEERGPRGQTGMPPMFNNPVFSDLAKELTETFDFENIEKEANPQNIGEAIEKIMTGDNPAKIAKLIGKFGNKMQQEVQRGNINPMELLQQTMGAMPNLANMMQNMGKNPQAQQMARNQSTRDRLRSKLEKKNAEKKQ